MRETYLWAESATAASVVAAWLIHMSQSFGLEPWPLDYWRFALEPDMYDRVLLQFSEIVSKSPPSGTSEPDDEDLDERFEFHDEDEFDDDEFDDE